MANGREIGSPIEISSGLNAGAADAADSAGEVWAGPESTAAASAGGASSAALEIAKPDTTPTPRSPTKTAIKNMAQVALKRVRGKRNRSGKRKADMKRVLMRAEPQKPTAEHKNRNDPKTGVRMAGGADAEPDVSRSATSASTTNWCPNKAPSTGEYKKIFQSMLTPLESMIFVISHTLCTAMEVRRASAGNAATL